MTCAFARTTAGCRCTRCGRQVRGHSGEGLIADCRATCIHLGPATGDVALVPCPSCRGHVRLKLPTFACATFGQCAPEAQHDNGVVAGCRGCEQLSPRPAP
jgi:hypothetical protein